MIRKKIDFLPLVKWLLFMGIGSTICFAWISLEYATTGEVQQSKIDSLMMIVTTTSLYFNLMHRVKFRGDGE